MALVGAGVATIRDEAQRLLGGRYGKLKMVWLVYQLALLTLLRRTAYVRVLVMGDALGHSTNTSISPVPLRKSCHGCLPLVRRLCR